MPPLPYALSTVAAEAGPQPLSSTVEEPNLRLDPFWETWIPESPPTTAFLATVATLSTADVAVFQVFDANEVAAFTPLETVVVAVSQAFPIVFFAPSTTPPTLSPKRLIVLIILTMGLITPPIRETIPLLRGEYISSPDALNEFNVESKVPISLSLWLYSQSFSTIFFTSGIDFLAFVNISDILLPAAFTTVGIVNPTLNPKLASPEINVPSFPPAPESSEAQSPIISPASIWFFFASPIADTLSASSFIFSPKAVAPFTNSCPAKDTSVGIVSP